MLFEQHGDEVYAYICFNVGRQSDAEDILQEVFLRILQSWGRFHHKSSLKTWLWSITNNCIREYFRRQKRTGQTVPFEWDIADVQSDETLILDLQRSLECLTTDQRQVFVERIINDKSSNEASELLGWSETKVRTTLHRAIKNVKAWFVKKGELE